MLRFILCLTTAVLLPVLSLAQEPPASNQPPVHEHVEVPAVLLNPTKESTGTAWLPAATPMYGLHRPWRGWDLRVNGSVFAQVIFEPNDRHRTGGFGRQQLASPNWGMATLRRGLGDGRLGVRAMLSAEPATMRDCGSLNLLATGEICDGDTIHDRQQAHDLVMELAADYDAPIAGGWRWQIYGGIAGEPSLGAVGYSHRPSAADNPMRPITHHWLEAAPSTFGVVTFGLHNQRWKAEASVFNGRAPDEQRSDLDFGKFDSVATRLSFLPSDRLALQISIGRLHEARSEFLRQPQNVDTRAIASATYHRPLESNGLWSTTAAFGVDKARETVLGTTADILSAAALVESTVTLSERHTFFGRIEAAGMPAHHLHAIEFGASVFTVGKVQFGYVRHLGNLKGLVPGLGGSAALSFLPSAFAPRYGGSTAPTFSVFFSLRPVRHAM